MLTQLPSCIAELADLKAQRREACNRHSCQMLRRKGFWCWRCRRLQQRLCRAYHACGDAVQELVARITYEVVFDMLDIHAVALAQWLNARWRRDCGHTVRLLRLSKVVMAARGGEAPKWLQLHEALRNAAL
jgi:hypothetical protein